MGEKGFKVGPGSRRFIGQGRAAPVVECGQLVDCFYGILRGLGNGMEEESDPLFVVPAFPYFRHPVVIFDAVGF